MDGREDVTVAAEFDPEPSAVAAARRFVGDTLASWDLPGGADLVADAVLLASELVTNAIVHAGTRVRLSCRHDGPAVEVSVLDRYPARMIPEPPSDDADPFRAAGRGLVLPPALSSSWGVSYGPDAKAVWFRLGAGTAGEVAAAPPVGDQAEALDETPAEAPSDQAAPGRTEPGPALGDLLRLGYHELLAHAVERARRAVTADAVYALIADEDGELRMRAAVGDVRPIEDVSGADVSPSGMDNFLALYDHLAGRGAGGAGLAGGETGPVPGEPHQSLVTVPFLAGDRVIGVLTVAAAEPDRFTEADLAIVQQVADQVALPLERARLTELDRARRGRISFLAEASDLLAGTLDREKIIALAAQLVVPRLAAWCAVLLPDEAGELRPGYVWHEDESRADELGGLLRQAPPPPAGGTGAREWRLAVPPESATATDADLAPDPAWCFPLRARDRSLGVFVTGRLRGGAVPRESMELAEDLTRRVALALDNARLYAEQLRATHALQHSLLPPELPEIPGVDLAAAYQAAGEGTEVGGDFYDVFEAAPGRWRFAIGDVCGKGPEAAAVTGLTRHALRILAREGHGVPTVLERLNALIVAEGPRAPFVTLVHGELVPAGGRAASISMTCAGHPLPLLLRAAGGVRPAARSQPLLGVFDEVAFDTDTVRISPGDVLLCVTDGVTERRSDGRLLDDDEGLRHLLGECAGLNAGAVAARIQRTVDEFGSGPPTDDLALLVFRGA